MTILIEILQKQEKRKNRGEAFLSVKGKNKKSFEKSIKRANQT